MRQDLISSNIANSETPGYKAKRIDFENALARALDIDGESSLKVSDDRHYDVGGGGNLNEISLDIYEDPNGAISENGNTVDRDSEMAKTVENKIPMMRHSVVEQTISQEIYS